MAEIRESATQGDEPLTSLPGIGARRAASIHDALGIAGCAALAQVLPRSYEEPAPWRMLAEAEDGERIRVRVLVRGSSLWRRGRRSTLTVRVEDDSGKARALWFHQPWLEDHFEEGMDLALEGRVSIRRGVRLLSPRVLKEVAEGSGLRPLYPEVEGVPPAVVARAIWEAFSRVPPLDPLPPWLLAWAQVPPLEDALSFLHQPQDEADLEKGRRRMALGEVVSLERARLADCSVPAANLFHASPKVWERILARFPFKPTPGQAEVLGLLRQDLDSGMPVRRLLHGEVGSGKTMVAFGLSLAVVAGGGQVGILAPTEILARQHIAVFRRWLQGSRVRVAGIFGDDAAAERKSALGEIESGRADIVVGTHALLTPRVVFKDLALVVFDEQHRFGVRQKAALLAKADRPHVLTMTATPIPRTLAWSRYGALEPCTLHERAGTSAPVSTEALPLNDWPEVADGLRAGLEAREKLFLVLPRIDGSEGLLSETERLRTGAWKGIPMAVVHGRLPGTETAARVEAFVRGEVTVLAGTTVVEVGLDVPGVPTMAVVGAQRLGLASLHQLRGRLSRGAGAPHGRFLVFSEPSSLERLRLLEDHRDGFQVAELDFQLRGSGSLRGTRQHGRADFQLFRPREDGDLVELLARDKVRNWLTAAD